MEDNKTLVIEAHDMYGDCLEISVGNKQEIKRGPEGFVEIYELDKDNKKQLIGKHNLVVYLGREWLLSRAFNVKNDDIDPNPDEYICWLGVGDGGCPIGDPLNPTSPTNLDVELSNPVMINPSDSSYGDYRVSPDIGYYKSPLNNFTFEQDSDNYNSWLIMQVSTTLTLSDAIGFNLNEAGLYTASSNVGGYAGIFNLYAKITFPTIVKTVSRQLLFVWYVYF
jgi:hypothetical protein